MSVVRLNRDRLTRLMTAEGFALNLPEALKGGISFIRESSEPRLYEHIRVAPSPGAYADLILSAATYASCHRPVSEVDDRLRTFLTDNNWYRAADLTTANEATEWVDRLAANASSFARTSSMERGPLLAQRLQSVFDAVDRCTRSLGDLFSIFDREFAFLTEATNVEHAETERLARFGWRNLYLNSEDAELASSLLVRFADKSVGQELTAKLILLTDYIRKQRCEYGHVGGLGRQRTT
jgi:hypothetical protein